MNRWITCPVCDGRVEWVDALGEACCDRCTSSWDRNGQPTTTRPPLEYLHELLEAVEG